ncbi:hypothetical protein [Methylobacterium oryzisoli]
MSIALQIVGVALVLAVGGLLALKVAAEVYDRNTREIKKRQRGE